MAHGIGTIIELRLEADGLSGRIACPPGLRPAPGQYLLATPPDVTDPLPVVLYPSGGGIAGGGSIAGGSIAGGGIAGGMAGGELHVAGPLPASWMAGMQLYLRGPLGNGFRLPPSARRVAIASLDGSPARLLPLAGLALAQQAAVAVYASAAIAGLPAEVEILPLDLLPEAPAWADFLALEALSHHLPAARQQLGLGPYQRLPCQAQVLVLTPIACGGLAECGVCAVLTRSGWALACADGPVFDFNQLEGG